MSLLNLTLPQSPPPASDNVTRRLMVTLPRSNRLTSAVFTEAPGPRLHSKKAQGLQTLQLIRGAVQRHPVLGGKIQSDFEGLRSQVNAS